MIDLTTEDHAAVASASRQLTARYRGFCEYEDIQQELYIFLLRHYPKMCSYRQEHEVRYAERLVTKALKNAGDKYCRKEKAVRSGYEPDDEFFYTIPMVCDMLQLYFDPEWMEPAVQVGRQAGGRPPNEGGNLMAMVADAGKAFETMPADDQRLLRRVFDGKMTVRDAIDVEATDWGINHNAADHRIRRVAGRLRAKLGGPRPYEESA